MKSLIKRTIRSLGFDLSHYSPASSEAAQLLKILIVHEVNLILDVGANTGQFGSYLRDAGYRGRILSFEPISTSWNQLIKNSKGDDLWDVAPRAAIGNNDGEIEIHVSENSVSSSVLNMLDAHSNSAPDSRYIGVERVPLRRIDSAVKNYLAQDAKIFLKIDTQGYEDRVLEGAVDILPRVTVIQLELSLVPLYEDQRLFDELILKLKSYGFELWAITPVFIDPKSGRLLQIDATFCRCIN
jgi:FkbM family methyltransferase